MKRAVTRAAASLCRPALLPALALLAACAGPVPGTVDTPSSPTAATAAQAADRAMREDSSRYVIVALANPLQRVPVRAATSLAGYGAPPRYTTGMHAATLVEQIAREHGLAQAEAWPIPSLNVHCIVFRILGSRPREEVLAALAKDARIALAQPLQDFSVQAQPAADASAVAYNDPYAPLQRGFIGMSAAQAHRTTTGLGTHIAVIDTGAQTGHPDLQGRILETHNVVDDDAGAFQKDRHGTEVLGIMAATGNNLQGIVGMAPGARFSLYKACWYPAQPPGGGARCNSFTLAKALVAVMSSDARIVNMSLGGPSDPLLGQLLAQLIGQGRIIVAAVPSGGQRSGFPAGVPGVLAVDSADAAPHASSTDGVLLAPGRDILTLQPQGRYDFATGSSMAAAHVSGMVALLQSVEPRLDRDTIERLLLRSEVQDGTQPLMVNAERALASLSSSSTARFAAR